jgi:ribosomal protein S27AE
MRVIYSNLSKKLTGGPKTRLDAAERARRRQARIAAYEAQRRGLLMPQACERCGTESAEKHHGDYSKPLDVQWLCKRCHCVEHRGSSVARDIAV